MATDNQKELMNLVLQSNVNIVTCGNCGDVVLHKINDEEITCPYCSYTSEPCDFPDLFY
jgi:rubrerythrin